MQIIHENMSFLFYKQKAAYEMRISDGSSDVCSSDLNAASRAAMARRMQAARHLVSADLSQACRRAEQRRPYPCRWAVVRRCRVPAVSRAGAGVQGDTQPRSEERRVGKECVSTCRSWWSTYH